MYDRGQISNLSPNYGDTMYDRGQISNLSPSFNYGDTILNSVLIIQNVVCPPFYFTFSA